MTGFYSNRGSSVVIVGRRVQKGVRLVSIKALCKLQLTSFAEYAHLFESGHSFAPTVHRVIVVSIM